MQFEKISDDKIKVILNVSDLSYYNVDFHSFMSNPLNSQDFFATILDAAEKQIGFTTKDYNIKIEILSLSNIDFIINLTRLPIKTNFNKDNIKTKTQILGKVKNTLDSSRIDTCSTNSIYCFNYLTDFYDFALLFSSLKFNYPIAKNLKLYEYNNNFYLLINNLNTKNAVIFSSLITDFATYVHNYDILSQKLSEYGKLILKNNNFDFIKQ